MNDSKWRPDHLPEPQQLFKDFKAELKLNNLEAAIMVHATVLNGIRTEILNFDHQLTLGIRHGLENGINISIEK